MATTVGTRAGDPMIEINTTPLIDVLLVLLIMLIITVPAMTHAIRVDMPRTGDGAVAPASVAVLVDFDGTILWNGTPLANREELERQMRAEARRMPQPTLDVRADKRAKYDDVAHVLAIAQRSGMRSIAIEGSS